MTPSIRLPKPHDLVYRLDGGRVRKKALAGWELPSNVDRYRVRPHIVPTIHGKLLPTYAEIVHRIVPWATAFMVPSLWAIADEGDLKSRGGFIAEDDGTAIGQIGGVALGGTDDMVVSMARSPTSVLETVYHEAFHLIDRYLDEEEHSTIDEAVGTGIIYGEEGYLDTVKERRARAFAAWCIARAEGIRTPVLLPRNGESYSVEALFALIENGTMARWIMQAWETEDKPTPAPSLLRRAWDFFF